MAMFDEIVFAPEVCRTLDAPLVPTHVYQTKDLLDDDWYLQDVRRYFVGRDGLLYRMDTIGAHRDGDRIAYEKHATAIAFSGTLTCYGEWDSKMTGSCLRYYDAEFSHGRLLAVGSLNAVRAIADDVATDDAAAGIDASPYRCKPLLEELLVLQSSAHQRSRVRHGGSVSTHRPRLSSHRYDKRCLPGWKNPARGEP